MTETICPTIFDGKIISTNWSQILMATVAPDGVVSFRIQPKVQAGKPVTHYMQMDMTGDDPTNQRRGSTEFHGGGAFKVDHGDEIQKGMQAIFIQASNGDMTINCPNGTLNIIARNINLTATGSGNDGAVQVSSRVTTIDGETVDISSIASTKIHSEGNTDINGLSALNLFGGGVEMSDGSVKTKGSKNCLIPAAPGTLQEIQKSWLSLFAGAGIVVAGDIAEGALGDD